MITKSCILISIKRASITELKGLHTRLDNNFNDTGFTELQIKTGQRFVSLDLNNKIFQNSLKNINKLVCWNFKLKNLTTLNTNILNIEFNNLFLRKIELHYFKNLKKLRHLIIRMNDIEKIKNKTFIDLNELIELKLGDNKIKYIESNAFAGLYYLQKLDLTLNIILELHVDTFNIMDRVGNSRVKNITFIKLHRSDLAVIKSRSFVFGEMESIDLSDNIIYTIEQNAFSFIKINYILLERNYLSSIDEHVFTTLNINILLSIYENDIQCNSSLYWIATHTEMLSHLNNQTNKDIQCYNYNIQLVNYVEHLQCTSIKGIIIILYILLLFI